MGAHRFRIGTTSCPQRVWSVLTNPAELYGVAITSTWEPGAKVRVACGTAGAVSGRVLHVAPRERLSFSIDDPSGETTFITWELRATGAGSVVRLYVDETTATCEADAEEVWLPIMSRLTEGVRA